jgi:6-methylsalicylate decarboxylase
MMSPKNTCQYVRGCQRLASSFAPTGVGADRRRFLAGAVATVGSAIGLARSPALAQIRNTAPARPHRIDVHYHLLPERYFANERARTALTAPLAGLGWSQDAIKVLLEQFDAARAVEELDRNGVATGVGSIVAGGVWFGDVALGRRLAREWNEDATQLSRRYPGRFGVFATLPLPDTEGSLSEIEYAFDSLHADGIGLMSSYEGKWLGDPSFSPVFEELNRRKAVVFVHPTAPLCCRALNAGAPSFFLEVPTDTARTITSLVFTGTHRRFPDIRFIFSHAGGTITVVAGRITELAHAAPAMKERIPNGFEAELARFYFDTAGGADPVAIGALRAVVPTSQILFGGDYPFAPISTTATGLSKLGMAADDLQAIERDNALRLLPRLRTQPPAR